MSSNDLTKTALRILQESLDSEQISLEKKAEIALKILNLQALEVKPLGDRPIADPAVTLPIPELYALSEIWQKWLIENKLRGVSDQSLVDILKGQNIEETVANQIVFALPQEVTFRFIEPQWRSLQQYKLIAELYREQENLKSAEIVRQTQLTKSEFQQKYYFSHRPVILTDLGNQSWQNETNLLENWLEKFGDRPIITKNFPVLHQKKDISQKFDSAPIQTLRDYFAEPEPRVYVDLDLSDWDDTALQEFWTNYSQLSEYLEVKDTNHGNVEFWLQSTFLPFPLQAKAEAILVLQVCGESQWHLASPWQSEFLYGDENWVTHINIKEPDLRRYPLLEKATFQVVNLQAGEALFIPALWWQQCHAIRNSTQAICSNFKD